MKTNLQEILKENLLEEKKRNKKELKEFMNISKFSIALRYL